MNTKQTVKTIHDIADTLYNYAGIIRQEARELEETGNLFLVTDVIQHIASMNSNLRLDILYKQLAKEFQKENLRLDSLYEQLAKELQKEIKQ